MDISLERRFLSSFKLIGSGKKVCDISSDIVVPDTKEDILRVIMTNAEYSIRSKDVEIAVAVAFLAYADLGVYHDLSRVKYPSIDRDNAKLGNGRTAAVGGAYLELALKGNVRA